MDADEKKKGRVVLKRRYISDVVEVVEKPPPKPPKLHDTGVSEEVLSQLTDAFSLLYDPNFLGHLPPDEQLRHFKKRDLLETKLYKTALKAFGNQRFVRERLAKDNGRKRVFIAQPLSELRGFDSFSAPSSLPSIQKKLNEQHLSSQEQETSATASEAELSQYRSWLSNRRKQHDELQRMGDVESYLRGKSNLSAAEKRAMRKICDSKRPIPVEEEEAEEPVSSRHQIEQVAIKRPSPLALFIIDNELRKRKLRLADLFASIDRNKNWQLSREEFRNAIRKSRIPLPEPLLEDMIITLDQDNNNELDYRELAQGLDQFRRERRSPEFLSLLSEQSNQFLLASNKSLNSDEQMPDSPDEQQQQQQNHEKEQMHEEDEEGQQRDSVASTSFSRRSSPQSSLQPGKFDTSQERYSVNNREQSVDLRKRDQLALRQSKQPRRAAAKTMIKTFDKEIDAHMSLSTLPEQELADMVDNFRQQQLREYSAVVSACQQRGVVFSERMYKRVMLHPADRPIRQIQRHVRPPGHKSELPLELMYSSGAGRTKRGLFGDRGGAASASNSDGDQRRVGKGRPVANLARAGADLPTLDELRIDDEDAEQELPTGTALIRPRVDCWLTFEQFQRLSEGIDYSKQSATRRPRRDAFWPGRLEQRVRVYLDSAKDTVHGAGVLFQSTNQSSRPHRTHPYHARESWPINNGHVTYGSIDPMLRHEITGGGGL